MKIVHLLLAAVITCTIGLSVMPGVTNSAFAATSKKEATSTAVSGITKTKKEIPQNVNINTADKKLLIQLPGIGPVTADRIIQYRKDNGQFKSIDELTKVKGIGTKTLVKFKTCLQRI